ADDRYGSRAREPDRPVRGGMRQRHAGREHEHGDRRPVDVAQIGGDKPGGRGVRHLLRVVVAGDDFGAASLERLAAREPRAAEAEYGDLLAGEIGDRDHRNITSASTSTVPSAQPTPP